jgi:hypothetical protein
VVPIVVLLILGTLLWYWEHRKRVNAEYEARKWENTAQRAQGSGNQGYLKRTGTGLFGLAMPLSELSGTGNPPYK